MPCQLFRISRGMFGKFHYCLFQTFPRKLKHTLRSLPARIHRLPAISSQTGRTPMASFRAPWPLRPGWTGVPLRRTIYPTRRTLVAPPRPNSGPLLSRRADRELPSAGSHRRWLGTIPVFAVILVASALGIFNYQKSSSSVVNSNLYALRRSAKAREALGDEIYFAHRIPWISGELNQLHGRIDISFWVKGSKAQGKMRFKSTRESKRSFVSRPHILLSDRFSFSFN